mgnify:CR=1 FL=1
MSKKVGFLAWKATPDGHDTFKRYLVLYSEGTIRGEIDKMFTWSQGDGLTTVRTERGWRQFVRNWMMSKPMFDAKRRPSLTAKQESEYYSKKRRDGETNMLTIGEVLGSLEIGKEKTELCCHCKHTLRVTP